MMPRLPSKVPITNICLHRRTTTNELMAALSDHVDEEPFELKQNS